jgi:serine/threonine protein kinase
VNIACAVYLETTCMIVLKSRIVYLRVDVLLQHINIIYGSRPFWAQTESGIFCLVLRVDPNFDDSPWQSVSPEAKDFVKRLLNKDYRKRMTAAQALCKYSQCFTMFFFLPICCSFIFFCQFVVLSYFSAILALLHKTVILLLAEFLRQSVLLTRELVGLVIDS